jgi:hemerythrin superfamily protein
MDHKKGWEVQRDWIEEIARTVETLISDPSNRHRQTLLDIIQEYLRVLDQHAHAENQPRLEEVRSRVALLNAYASSEPDS